MVAAAGAEFLIIPPLVIGVIAGLYELFLVHKDERGMGWLSHGLHAVPVCMIFSFISFNIPFAIAQFGLSSSIPSGGIWDILIRVVLGLVAAVKIKAAAAIIRGGAGGKSIGETFFHAALVGAVIAAGPYIYGFLVAKALLPEWAMI